MMLCFCIPNSRGSRRVNDFEKKIAVRRCSKYCKFTLYFFVRGIISKLSIQMVKIKLTTSTLNRRQKQNTDTKK